MPEWTDPFERRLDGILAGLDRGAVLARYGWVEDMARRAGELLSPERLASAPPEDIYRTLDSLNVPGCAVRMTNLGRMNRAGTVVDGVRRLLEVPGDFAVKCRAGKIPQAGITTLTQILSLARPDRFAIRNAPFTRALARMVPFYTPRALDELGYGEYLDLCRELTRPLALRLKPLGLSAWAGAHRFLLLYAVLTAK
ncbi:MAG: hypothetical protein LBJ46_09610 [Planctomycetota bacterium]|jgi:hypothetical protein|nr:hypothetical protein [Planctomycetota bacterium]